MAFNHALKNGTLLVEVESDRHALVAEAAMKLISAVLM